MSLLKVVNLFTVIDLKEFAVNLMTGIYVVYSEKKYSHSKSMKRDIPKYYVVKRSQVEQELTKE